MFKRSIWWKVYFFCMTILVAMAILTFLVSDSVEIVDYIGLPFLVVAAIGLFGYVFLKQILDDFLGCTNSV